MISNGLMTLPPYPQAVQQEISLALFNFYQADLSSGLFYLLNAIVGPEQVLVTISHPLVV
jgi:hypothetical protein